ncbi:hypothetical protein LTR36_007184 [Oleoguttula mirabilis]|uniref:Ribosomal protein S15 n=1 Tax=Oleoguttula mirabilis TaxID=1507867 RepID=A0AAV9JB09_9PEZI|nr:hypothetical protein LTR36_007184 [Oleoguttula mirabilis]
MPPRIPLLQCLRASHPPPSAPVCRAFTSTASSQASTVTQKRRHRDPYALAQAKARKAANLSRQEVLKKERAGALGDPVRGITTPFVQSFDTALAPEPAAQTQSTQTRVQESPSEDAPGPRTETGDYLNFYLSKPELKQGVEHSKWLSTPSKELIEYDDPTLEATPEERQDMLLQEQEVAEEALRRIASLSIGSSKDRLRVNTQRCISTFGRHNTDDTLTPLLTSQRTMPRIGLDTGSSEVQIAILTAKIRTLADFLQTRGTMDKVNKRNLRLLVHRRAKLLQYLRRKERGGPRWQHVIETLGLTEGTWKGEISM